MVKEKRAEKHRGTHNWGNNRVYIFAKHFSLRMNVIARLESEVAYYNIEIHHIIYKPWWQLS